MDDSWIRSQPDGIINKIQGDFQTTIIEKSGSQVTLKLISVDSNEWQSRIDLDNPKKLLSPYTFGMLLSLLWNENISRIHILGLGGGILPTFLRSCFPDLYIDCTEIDGDVLELAETYFGFQVDERMRVIIGDGREYLTSRDNSSLYDIIFVDAFRGVGFSPPQLATIEFLEICRSQLTADGILAMNLMPRDPLVDERIATVRSAFQNTYQIVESGLIIFGTNSNQINDHELAIRAEKFAGQHNLDFPFRKLAESLIASPAHAVEGGQTESAPILTDALVAKMMLHIPKYLIARLKPKTPCPCGSGLRLDKCHAVHLTAESAE